MARKPAPKKSNNPKVDELSIKTLKTGTCKTLAGTSTLTYLIGIDDKEVPHWKIAENSGGGMFSQEWVAHADIQAAFEAWPEGKAINSMTLRPLLQGKSINTPAFLLAALSAEKLLTPKPKKKRCHVACDPAPFLEAMDKLKGKKVPARKKTTAKAKRSTPRKKASAKSK